MKQEDIIILKQKVKTLEKNIYELEEQRVYLSKRIKDYTSIIDIYKKLTEVQENYITTLEEK
tara:strand:- start:454 stop:639 length:186 start_codon:yes stop_codon:yes gene_type:complete